MAYTQCLGNNILSRYTIEHFQTISRITTSGIEAQSAHCIIQLKDWRLLTWHNRYIR